MSLTLEVRIGRQVRQWAMSNAALGGLAHVAKNGLDDAARILWDEKTPYGKQRRVDHEKLLAALDRLHPMANKIARGFQMRHRPSHLNEDLLSRGVSGVIIDGATYMIWCEDDFWTLTPVSDSDDVTEFYKNKGSPRRDEAELRTQNMGVVKIEVKKGKSDVAKLLADVRKFVRAAKGDTARITIG